MECRVLFFFVIVSVLPIVEMSIRDGKLEGVRSSNVRSSGEFVFLDPTGFEYLGRPEYKAYCKEVSKTPIPYENNDYYNKMQVKLANEKGEVIDEEDHIDFFSREKIRFFTCAFKQEISAFHAVEEVYESYTNKPIKTVFFKHHHLKVSRCKDSKRVRITRMTFVPYMDWTSRARDLIGKKVIILKEPEKTTK